MPPPASGRASILPVAQLLLTALAVAALVVVAFLVLRLNQSLDSIGQRFDTVDQRFEAMDEQLDAIATDAHAAAEAFGMPPPLGEGPAPSPVTGELGQPFDVDVADEYGYMAAGRYTVLSAERLDNDVAVRIRWEATVGPLTVSAFSWRGYDDTGNQFDGSEFSSDMQPSEFGPALEAVLAEGRQREGIVYLPGAAGAEHLWIELFDFASGSALATVELW